MRCVLVTNLESSGSSCVAGILHNLGVNMGDKLRGTSTTNLKGYFEDITFIHRFDDFCSRDRWQKALHEWIEERANCEIWGLKYSLLKTIGDKVLRVFEQDFPEIEIKFIYVRRDIANIVKSQARKRPKSDFKTVQCNAISAQIKLDRFIDKIRLKYPVLDVYYDDVIAETENEVERLAQYCFSDGYEGFVIDGGFQKAVEFVEPAMRRFW